HAAVRSAGTRRSLNGMPPPRPLRTAAAQNGFPLCGSGRSQTLTRTDDVGRVVSDRLRRTNTSRARGNVRADVPVLVITGKMGSGKTTILGETSDLLTAHGIGHAAIDLDTLGIGHLPERAWADLSYRNLACVWQNYVAAGATRLLLAAAVENVGEL